MAGEGIGSIFTLIEAKMMIKDIPNIDKYITNERLNGVLCTQIELEFSTNLKDNIYQLAQLLESDGFAITLKKRFLGNWKLSLEIPIIKKFDDEDYQTILGKFYVLASRSSVEIRRIGILM